MLSGRSAEDQTSFRFASPESCPALVLNADFRPLSYFPLSVWPWEETVKAVFMGRVNIVSHYERFVRSPTFAMQLPSVVSLKSYIPTARRPAFTRFNVFLRDRFTCQYCGRHTSTENLTFDHVIPKSMGGLTTWQNVVAACEPCNLRKGGLLPAAANMHPRKTPFPPTVRELQENGRAYPPNHLHQSWRDFLYWDSELEAK